jgi:hypothetical protein
VGAARSPTDLFQRATVAVLVGEPASLICTDSSGSDWTLSWFAGCRRRVGWLLLLKVFLFACLLRLSFEFIRFSLHISLDLIALSRSHIVKLTVHPWVACQLGTEMPFAQFGVDQEQFALDGKELVEGGGRLRLLL